MATNFDISDFRRALGTFMTGVTVITTSDPETSVPVGFTANSFTSLSLDPPLVLVCLGNKANLYKVFERAEGFAVNILAAHQREISNCFASPVEDRFAGLNWQLSTNNNPLIDSVSAWLDCTFERRFTAGDHMVMIGEVKSFVTSELSGLGYVRGSYFNDSVEKTALDTFSKQRQMKAGAVVEHQGRLLLLDDQGSLSLPCSSAQARAAVAMDELKAKLVELGVDGDLGLLYAVREDERDHFSSMYFHVYCHHAPETAGNAVMVPMQEIDLSCFNTFERGIVERYVREHARGRYGIYFGSEDTGEVTMRGVERTGR